MIIVNIRISPNFSVTKLSYPGDIGIVIAIERSGLRLRLRAGHYSAPCFHCSPSFSAWLQMTCRLFGSASILLPYIWYRASGRLRQAEQAMADFVHVTDSSGPVLADSGHVLASPGHVQFMPGHVPGWLGHVLRSRGQAPSGRLKAPAR